MSDPYRETLASYVTRARSRRAYATNISIRTTGKTPLRAFFRGMLSLSLLIVLAATGLLPGHLLASNATVVAAQATCGTQWQLMPSPNLAGALNVLDTLSASSPSDIWAVGYTYASFNGAWARTLAMHWDGAAWATTATPNPGPDSNYLNGVRTFGPNDAWAVGDAGSGSVQRNVLLHWDGSSWSTVTIPSLANANVAFNAIDGVSSKDLWVVGVKGRGDRGAIYHYDGNVWSGVETALSPSYYSALFNVVARASDDVWATGTTEIGGKLGAVELHWDGAHWQNLTTKAPNIAVGYDLAVPGPDNARFVVGTDGSGSTRQPGILHVDGSTREVTGSEFHVADHNALTGVVALSRSEAWAVGYGKPGGESTKGDQYQIPLVLHTTNGSAWFEEQTVSLDGNYSLIDITAVPGTHDLIAAGTANGRTLIERYGDPCSAVAPTATSPAATPVAPTPTPAAAPTYAATPIPGQDQASQTFSQTGKTVKGLFLDYWNKNGGLMQQGYPISEMFTEISALNGQPYTVQYFERAVFEYHPENQAPYDVLLSQLGKFQYKDRYGAQGAPDQQPNNDAGSQLFAATGKRVGGKFLEYWQAHGGLAQQGYPISDEFIEKSPLDGKDYRVQYFERAVFEYHPENQAPYDVLLSQLGTFQYKARYPGSK